MSEKIEKNNKGRVLLQRIVGKIVKDQQEYNELRWFEAHKPINFGSLMEPKNEDIVRIRIEVPEDRNKRGNIFENLFRG